MAGINTSVSVTDQLSPVFQTMTASINACIGTFIEMQDAADRGLSTTQVESLNACLADMNAAVMEYSESLEGVDKEQRAINDDIAKADQEQRALNDSIEKGSNSVAAFAGKIAGIAASYVGINKTISFMNDSMEAFNTQLNAETQLTSVLKNSLDFSVDVDTSAVDQLSDAFDSIKDKASEIQSNGIYGDEAMIGAAGEFATYFSDTDAIESMMDTLADYTMGMTGGGEVGEEEMVNYATNLGKIMTGSYDAMTKKGFEFTDQQKAIIEGTATEAEVAATLGEEYVGMSSDMQAAAAINQVIAESWDGLYETMSNTPEGEIIQMKNAWGDMKEVVGQQVYPAVLQFVKVFNDNQATISNVLAGVANGFSAVMNVASIVVSYLVQGAGWIADNWSMIEPVIVAVTVALGAYVGALAVYNTVQAVSNGLKTLGAIAAVAHGTATAAEAAATTGMTASQVAFNAALYACPITWILAAIIAIIAAIYLVVAAINKFQGTSISATGIIGAAFAVAGAYTLNTFVVPLQNGLAMVANFLGNVFTNPIASVKILFYDMALTVLGYITNMASAIETLLNKIPGVSVDITSGLDSFYSSLEAAQQEVKDESGWVEYVSKMDYVSYESAAQAGYDTGSSIESSVSDFFDTSSLTDILPDSIAAGLGDFNETAAITAENTGDMADSLETSEDSMEWMKDIAEREIIDRTVFRDIKVDMGGVNNTVNNMQDLDSIGQYLANSIEEQMAVSAEGA
jgi:hypothetical protein